MEKKQTSSKAKMFRRNVKPKSNFKVEETLQIALHQQIDDFIEDESQAMLTFPATLTNIERGYIHTYVARKGLKSKSTGKGADRTLNIFKQKENTNINMASFSLPPTARKLVHNYLKDNPLTWNEKKNLQSSINSTNEVNSSFSCTLASTNNVSIIVPPATQNPQADSQRRSLPIYAYRQHIIDTIDQNQVVVISGDTGSGKTTQVPQYLLETNQKRQKPCRIICTQPRRIAAISISDRVAFERGERLGDAIGYQVRLESQLSPKSNLIFTTSGYLLRCLVSGTKREIFKTTTHIILDEVHERDKFTDFLLIAIKDALTSYPDLKIILMSATIDSNVFINYFDGGCPHVDIPGRMFKVNVFHLEETLSMVGYTNQKIQAYVERMQENSAATGSNEVATAAEQQQTTVDPEMAQYLDSILKECEVPETSDEAFAQFYYLVTGESVPIDFKHTETKMTALMVAAALDNLTAVKTLIQMGAICSVVDGQNRNAYAWAVQQERHECAAFLLPFEQPQNQVNPGQDPRAALLQLLLQEYQAKSNEDDIDHYILFSLIRYIHKQLPAGAILVFLPGYDAIVEQNETINNYISGNEMDDNVSIFMLHGNMSATDQKLVFKPVGTGMRKIILSTNIAETSLTIDDVVYVIDCGKVKQKSFDAFTGATSLTSTYISQACAKQRMGRAGRVQPGVCFRLYSTLRHQSMDPFTLPELLRVPLTDISLNAKFLAGEASIAEFLGKAVQPPSPLSVSQSVKLLQKIGALDDAENITELGAHLVDLPVDVQLGKTLIYAVLLKCLDPVLTIVSALSVKDPFVLPNLDGGEAYTKTTRKTFSEDTFSDHAVLLKVFQAWNEARTNNSDRQFCRDNFISNGTMQMISGIRAQLLSHLRSTDLIRPRGPGNIQELNTNSNCWAIVKAALTAGLYPNVGRIDRKVGQLKSSLVSKLVPHPSSVLRDKNPKKCQENLRALPSEWMIYGEKSRVGRFCMVRYTTLVSPLNIALMAGPICLPADSVKILENDSDSENEEDDEDNGAANNDEKAMLHIDDWIQFVADTDSAHYVFQLRQKLSSIMLRIIQDPKKALLAKDKQCVNLVVQLLQNEDYEQHLPQMKNPGKCPFAVKPAFGRDISYGQMNGANGGESSYSSYNNHRTQENWRSNPQPKQQSQENWRSNQSQPEIQPRQQQFFARPQYQPTYKQQQAQYQPSYKQQKPQQSYPTQQPAYKNQPKHYKQQQVSTNAIAQNGNSASAIKASPIRYFIVRAASEQQIQQLYLSGTWSMSQTVLTNFLNIQRAGHAEIFIFFYIPSMQELFTVAKFLSGPLTFSFEIMPITHAKLGASLVRSVKNSDGNNLLQTLEKCSDGEEICDVDVNKLLQLFNSL